ncbi:MAG: ParB/RepB/Spo0J family partition protein [Bacteroidales bacterium]|nr:ParB/RepB/Spo0J family partition protein [Bacteroidales bacterium]
MAAQRNALGKGLSALLGDANDLQPKNAPVEAAPHKASVLTYEIPISEIEPNPFQPRTEFDPEALNELAESIKNVGIIQPLTVRQLSARKYQIISGERRFRAAKKAGLKSVPAYVRQAGDTDMLEMAIVENIQRQDLDPIETALSFRRLMEECNLTQESMADRVGKKRASVANSLRLLKLPAEIQKALRTGAISVGHAKVLLSLAEEDSQLAFCEKTVLGDLSVRALEEAIERFNAEKESVKENKKQNLSDNYYRLLEVMGKYFKNRISLKTLPNGSGKLTIKFADESELARFLQDLEGNNF